MKNVIVTGATGNLGNAVIHHYLNKGHQVTGTVIPNDTTALNIENKLFNSVIIDLMNEADSENFIQSVIHNKQSIDVAVLTVGGFAMGSIAATTTSDIAKQYKLNFETAYNIARPVFIQMMKQGSGHIFLIGSQPGKNMTNSNGMVAYGLAKSLLFRLAELMNGEAKGTDIITTVVIPSTIDTPQNRKSMPDADFSKWIAPEKLAELIYLNSISEKPDRIIEV